jgi:hypothetical protein
MTINVRVFARCPKCLESRGVRMLVKEGEASMPEAFCVLCGTELVWNYGSFAVWHAHRPLSERYSELLAAARAALKTPGDPEAWEEFAAAVEELTDVKVGE